MKDSSTIPAGFEDPRGRMFQERYAISELVAAALHRIVPIGNEVEGGQRAAGTSRRPCS